MYKIASVLLITQKYVCVCIVYVCMYVFNEMFRITFPNASSINWRLAISEILF